MLWQWLRHPTTAGLRARVKKSIKGISSVSVTTHQFDLDYQTNTQLHFPKHAFSPDENRHHGACNDSTAYIHSQAMPTAASLVSGVRSLLPRTLEARGFNGMGPVTLYLAVKDYLKDRNAVRCHDFHAFQSVANVWTV
jgi:hypothetical protein